ncbi:MAG TPA: hypothetical protein VND45_07400 [Thermoanaerobaculia bacterium]|jgi:hypothetical protein|nr:hypothetical protein [Thermoanaerobaculia bacterium]
MIERRPEWPPRLARLISVVAHPLILSPLTVAAASRNWRWTLVVAAATIVPLSAVILWKMHRGVWSDFDVTRRDQRSGLYTVALPLFAAAALFLPEPGLRGAMISLLVVLLIAFFASRWLQTSLHMLFAAFNAVILWRVYPWSPLVMLPLGAALAWARLRLRHHTPPELAAGTILGLAAGIYTIS